MPLSSQRSRADAGRDIWGQNQSPAARQLAAFLGGVLLVLTAALPILPALPPPWPVAGLTSLVVLAAGLWVAYLLLGRETYTVFSTVGAPVLVLLTYGIVRYTTCEIESVGRPQMIAITSAGLLFLLALNFFRSRHQLVGLAWIVAGGGVALTAWVFWHVLGLPRASVLAGTGNEGLARALFRDPAELAVYLHFAFSLAGAFLLFSRRGANERLLFGLAAVVAVAGLALCQTPRYWAGWFVSAAVLGMFLLRKRGWKPRWFLLGGGVAVVFVFVGFLAASQLHFAAAPTKGVELTGEGAALPAAPVEGGSWQRVLSISHQHLLGGTGPGMAPWLYTALRADAPTTPPLVNEYLAAFAEYGIVGVLLAAWTIATIGFAAFRVLHLRAGRYSAATPSNRYAFAVGGFAALAAALTDALLGCSVRTWVNFPTLTIILAALLTCGLYHHGDPEDKPPKLGQYSLMRLKGVPRYVLALGLVLLLGVFGSRLYQTFPAAFFAETGRRAQQDLRLDDAQLAFRRACRLDPKDFAHAAALGDLLTVQATWNAPDRPALVREALRVYERALTLNPHHTDLLIQKARLYQLLGDNTEAATCYRQALLTDPRHPGYLIAEGLFLQDQQDFDRARQDFRRAHELDLLNPLPVLQLHRLAELTGASNAPPLPSAD